MGMDPELQAIVARLPVGRNPVPNVATAGQPTPQQLIELARAGFKAVIDLREPHEFRGFDESEVVSQCGMEYINIPITYQGIDAAEFDQFRDLLRDGNRHPVLVHCATANRVGALLLPHLVLDHGTAPDAALDVASQVGLRSPELARAAFEYVESARD